MKHQPSSFQYIKIKQIISYQYSLSLDAVDKFIPSHIQIEISKKTKRIRYIYLEDNLWGIIRPTNGIFLLTPASAKYLVKNLQSPKLRVIIQKDVADFIQKGGNVFAKHVLDADPTIIPFSEVIVVSQEDHPLAIGRAQMTRSEMLSFRDGVAVKVRKGI